MIFTGRFAGKVAVVTGAAQGIGRTVALRIAHEGGGLALIDRSELVEEVLMRITDAFLALPTLVVALLVLVRRFCGRGALRGWTRAKWRVKESNAVDHLPVERHQLPEGTHQAETILPPDADSVSEESE